MDIFNALATATAPFPIEYKGFMIERNLTIWKNGKQRFTAPWQRSDTIEEVKLIIDMSNIAKEITSGKRITAALKAAQEIDLYEIERDIEAQKLQDYNDKLLNDHWK